MVCPTWESPKSRRATSRHTCTPSTDEASSRGFGQGRLHEALANPRLREEALQILRGLIERVVIHPGEDGPQVELVGTIVRMVELGLDGKQAALPAEAAWIVGGCGGSQPPIIKLLGGCDLRARLPLERQGFSAVLPRVDGVRALDSPSNQHRRVRAIAYTGAE